MLWRGALARGSKESFVEVLWRDALAGCSAFIEEDHVRAWRVQLYAGCSGGVLWRDALAGCSGGCSAS